jgi:hypothetical protein
LYRVWKYSVVTLLAVAFAFTRGTSAVVSAAKGPPETLAHFRSAAGLFTRAGAPGEVLVAVHTAVDARMYSLQAEFELTVSVGPVVAFRPASKSAEVGVVSAVEFALI